MPLRPPTLPRLRAALRPPPSRRPLHQPSRRLNSATPSPPPPLQPPTPDRVSKIISRLPPRLQKYTSRLRGAPVTHVTAFLILHELTAIVPLFLLFGLFHYYTDVAPLERWMRDHYGTYVSQGMERFERYFRRKGWFGFEAEGEGNEARERIRREVQSGELEKDRRVGGEGERRYKVVVEVALAYAITKALLPVRIVGSVWATPWFAGVLGRLKRVVRR